MDEMNGIEVVDHLDSKTKVIFCTAYSEFAVKSYELNVVDYLMKPIGFERFEKAIQRVVGAQIETNDKEISNDYLFVKTGQKGKMVKIDFNDIIYIEGRSNYIAFHIFNKVILSHITLRDIETYLPKNMFMRVHKSYIISLNKIIAIENNEIRLAGSSASIPLSVGYKEAFLTRLVKI
jgi:DNA-binding LytR/AlgR family response regulator